MKTLCCCVLVSLAAIFSGCATGPAQSTDYNICPNNEWGKTHMRITSGNRSWGKEALDGKEYIVSNLVWKVMVEGKKQDEADRWWPDFVALGESAGYLDGMWSGMQGACPPQTFTNGKAGFTRYQIMWGDPTLIYPVIEVGNYEWCKGLKDWKVGMLGRCYPYRYLIQIRTTERNSKGMWVPPHRSDVCGHEIWHFIGLGGDFHKWPATYSLELKDLINPEDFWIE